MEKKEVNVIELIAKALDTKTRTFTGQLGHIMTDAIDHEFAQNGNLNNSQALTDIIERAEEGYNRVLCGVGKANRGIFNNEIDGSIGFQTYLLENILRGRTTFGLEYALEKGYTFNQESVEQLIAILQTLITKNE